MFQGTKPRPPLQPVSPDVVIVQPLIRPCPQFPAGLPGMVMLDGRPYQVAAIAGGFQVFKSTGDTYDVDPTYWTCDCGDGTFRSERPGGCKHVHAVRALLGKVGVQVPASAPRPIIPAARRFRSLGDFAANDPAGYAEEFGDGAA